MFKFFLILFTIINFVSFSNEFQKEPQKKYKMIVYPGRFQPFHQGHYAIINKTMEESDFTIIAISQANGMRKDERNVFEGDNRFTMIKDTLDYDHVNPSRYLILRLEDVSSGKSYKNNDEAEKDWGKLIKKWDENLINISYEEFEKKFKRKPKKSEIAFIFYNRDKANYRERMESKFSIIEIENPLQDDISATKIRTDFFENGEIDDNLPYGTRKFLKKFKNNQTSLAFKN